MRYMVRKSIIELIGQIWMPATTCAQRKDLSTYDVENIKAEGNGTIDRDAVEQWLTSNSGDFRSVTDFRASIEDGDNTIDIPWKDEESELTYNDCTFPSDD